MTPQQEAKLDKLIEQQAEIRKDIAVMQEKVSVNSIKLSVHADVIEDYKANKNKIKGGYITGSIIGGFVVSIFHFIFKGQ